MIAAHASKRAPQTCCLTSFCFDRGVLISADLGIGPKTPPNPCACGKVTGAALTSEHLRQPPLKEGKIPKLIGASLKSRGTGSPIDNGDLFILFDGMRHGNESLLMSGFKDPDGAALARAKTTVSVIYSEDSLTSRLSLVRGHQTIHQTEKMHLVTSEPIRVAKKPRLHFDGSNKGEIIAPVVAVDWNDERVWTATYEAKKTIYGRSNRHAIGGNTPGAEAGESSYRGRKREKDDLEPVCFHSHPYVVDEEILHDYPIKAIMHLTPGDGSMALAAIRKRIPFVGVCWTEEHKSGLTTHLEKQIFIAMQTEDDDLYEPALVEILKSGEGGCEGEDAEGEEEEKVEDPETDAEPELAKKKANQKTGRRAGNAKPNVHKANAKKGEVGRKAPKAVGKANKGAATRAAILAKLKNLGAGDGEGDDDEEEDSHE